MIPFFWFRVAKGPVARGGVQFRQVFRLSLYTHFAFPVAQWLYEMRLACGAKKITAAGPLSFCTRFPFIRQLPGEPLVAEDS